MSRVLLLIFNDYQLSIVATVMKMKFMPEMKFHVTCGHKIICGHQLLIFHLLHLPPPSLLRLKQQTNGSILLET